jgi:hypothetical protein
VDSSQFLAFIDESYTTDEFVLGGYIQSFDVWAEFEAAWARLLPEFGVKAKNGVAQFHMFDMKDRMEDVKRFSDVIDEHNLYPVSFRMNLADFRNAIMIVERRFARQEITIVWERWSDPYYFGFRHFLDGFHRRRYTLEPEISQGAKIDFFFDQRPDQHLILEAWSDVRAQMPQIEEAQFGRDPRFENKQEFLALQAADFSAWWARKWYEEDNSDVPTKLRRKDFGSWRGKRRLTITSNASQAYIIEHLTNMTVKNYGIRSGKFGEHAP